MIEYLLFLWQSTVGMIKKHKALVLGMIVLVSCSLYLFGCMLTQSENLEKSAGEYADTYGKKNFYFTNEGLNDIEYYEYLDEGNRSGILNLKKLRKNLLAEKDFQYIILSSQPLEILGFEVPDLFLCGYEDGTASESIFEYEGEPCYFTKSLQVSESFFKEFGIGISEGRGFTAEDYVYKKDKNIPVLAGKEYKNYLKTGDTFSGNYLFEKVTWEVVGFLEGETFFYNQANDGFESCERYLIMPSMTVKDDDYFSKILTLQQMSGVIVSDLGYQKTKERFEQLIANGNLGDWGIYMEDPVKSENSQRQLATYSSMTQEVLRQFQIILGLMLLFVVISVSSVLCGFIREKNREYGIHMLCGATPFQIFGDILLLDGLILGSGSFSALLALAYKNRSMEGAVGILSIAVMIGSVSALICYVYLKRMEISDIIGGKE